MHFSHFGNSNLGNFPCGGCQEHASSPLCHPSEGFPRGLVVSPCLVLVRSVRRARIRFWYILGMHRASDYLFILGWDSGIRYLKLVFPRKCPLVG